MKITNIGKLTYLMCWSLFLTLTLTVSGCGTTATQGDNTAATEENADATKKTAATAKPTTTIEKKTEVVLDETSSAATEAILLTPVIALSTNNTSVPKRAKKQPKGVIDFCKVKPYAKYKRQVKNGIKAAWEAKKTNKYGIGFRNKAEYKKWNSTQKDFFLYMFDACRTLALCEIDNNKGKKKKKDNCNVQQATFGVWQDSAKLFAKQVKKFKTQQPPALCGLQPKQGDVSLCFSQRAAQIDNACDGEECKELSQCWTSVAMKDDVIRQAESSCRFSGQKLSKCRGHMEATKRRKDRFNACNKMQSDIDLAFQP